MRQYLCSVALADSPQHIVTNKLVTIAEIAVLKRVHGESAVRDIRPPADKAMRDTDRTDPEERERLRMIYDTATPDAEPIVDRLFGPMAPLPTSLRNIGIDPQAAAEEMRRQAEAMAAAAATLAGEDDAPAVEDEDDFFEEPESVVEAKAAANKKAA